MQEDLEGVEIPDNPDYGYDEAYNDNYRLPQGLQETGCPKRSPRTSAAAHYGGRVV